MFERFDRSWRLFKTSWAVLREDKALAIFPFISTLATLLIIASFAVPVFALRGVHTTHGVDAATGSATSGFAVSPLGWALIAVGYFVLTYVTIFFNAALIYAANERLTGTGPGTVGSGFAGAKSKAGAILPWALLSATVSLILRMIEERAGFIGRIVISLVGIAWSLVTYLVVPVLILEGTTTGEAISRSSKMFKHTWGENVIGNAGFGIVSFGAFLVAGAIVVLGLATGSAVVIALAFVVAVVFLAVAIEVIAAMSGIYRVALYRYAADGQAPQAFSGFDFPGAFRPKKKGMFGSSGSSSGRSSTWTPGANPGYTAWTPPAEPPSQPGTFGITIPGQDDQGGQPPSAAPSPVPPPPPPPAPRGSSPWGDPPSPRGF